MTYDEYRSKNNKNNFFKSIISKLFTITIFTMIVIIASNYSVSFRNFIINDVLNSTMDFSKVNKLLNSTSKIFESNKTMIVNSEVSDNSEEYLDGVKYNVQNNSDVLLKDSGIVTYIGNKEGYGNTVIVQQSNGYYAWYGNIKESIKLYDYLEKGSVIGNSKGKYYYYALFKDNKKVDISEN